MKQWLDYRSGFSIDNLSALCFPNFTIIQMSQWIKLKTTCLRKLEKQQTFIVKGSYKIKRN